jgi:circadian clock protein KaiA
LTGSDEFTQLLSPYLGETDQAETRSDHYICHQFGDPESTLDYLRSAHVDCLVVQAIPELQTLFDGLHRQAIFIPTVIVEPVGETFRFAYHPALLALPTTQINQLRLTIDQAISKFIQLQPDPVIPEDAVSSESSLSHRLMAQQLRLAEKLKERLDYLGVYYKRNPQNFLRHMTPLQREELLRQLKADYREIILAYFSTREAHLNEKIDNFVNIAFFADVPISQVVEIHMELMDEFAKQLRLEGRNDEILLDYRLTLIDTLAHLCEMYRRSIPRES